MGLLFLLLAGCSREGAFPNRALTIVCPWAIGGGTDTVTQQIAHLLEKELGVRVNKKNATGGEGVTGHTEGARARPDGYTLTMMTPEISAFRWRGLTKLSHEDFAPLVVVNADAAAVFVRADSGSRTLKDLEARIRTASPRLKASGTANLGIWHLAMAGWFRKVGLRASDVIWVPMTGAGPSLQALLPKEGLDFVCCSLPEARTLLESGEIRCLGVMSEERSPDFPDVPTLREQGTDWTLVGWRGLGVPRATPPETARKLEEALTRVAKSGAFLESMKKLGFSPRCIASDEFGKHLVRMDAVSKEMVGALAFQAGERYGPMFFPAILAGALLLVGILLATRGGFRKEGGPGLDAAGRLRFLEVAAGVVFYLLVAETAGFVLTAGVMLFALLWRMGVRPWASALVAGGLVPIVYQVFAVQWRVGLPSGWLGWA